MKRRTEVYTATVEDNDSSNITNPRVEEMQYFMNLFETEQQDINFNHTDPTTSVPNPNMSAYLTGIDDGSVKRVIGPAITLKVSKGDNVDMKVYGKYEKDGTFTNDIVGTLLGALGNTFVNWNGLETTSTVESTFNSAFNLIGSYGDSDPNTPRGLLNYILFDENFVMVPGGFGFENISSSAGYDPMYGPLTVDFDELSLSVEVPQSGYIYVWVSNETANSKVWFDDLSVELTHNLVTEETDYYPFGEILSQWIEDSKKSYRYGYQGEFAEEDSETGWNSFELRMYDPVIGRWTTTDPVGQYWSPYLAFGNNPIMRVDPDGGFDIYMNNATGEVVNMEGVTGHVKGHTWLAADGASIGEVLDALNFFGLDYGFADGKMFADIRSRQLAEGMMEIFSPENVGMILLMAEGAGGGSSRGNSGKGLTARTLSKSFDDLTEGLTSTAVKHGVKFVSESGNIKQAFHQLQRAGYAITKSQQGKIFMKNIHTGEQLILRSSGSGGYRGLDTIMRVGNGSKNQSIWFKNSWY